MEVTDNVFLAAFKKKKNMTDNERGHFEQKNRFERHFI